MRILSFFNIQKGCKNVQNWKRNKKYSVDLYKGTKSYFAMIDDVTVVAASTCQLGTCRKILQDGFELS